MADVETATVDLQAALKDGGAAGLLAALHRLPIALVGRTTCGYSTEAQATLESAAAHVGGASAVSSFWLDRLPGGGADVWAALKGELKQATVPYVFVGGEFLGGCDDIKGLQSAGTLASKINAAAAAAGLGLASVKPRAANCAGADVNHDSPHSKGGEGNGQGPLLPDERIVATGVKPALADGARGAPACLFWFPEVVDSNVIRLTAAQVVIVCILAIVFRTHTWAHYMVLGLTLDNLSRFLFGSGPSPMAQTARCVAALMKPEFRPGVPKQFAGFCALFMSTVATIFMFLSGFDPQEIIPSIFLGMYAFLAALECVLDFCMGCVIFGFLVKFGILPPEVYALGISCKPEAEYTYAEAVKRIDLPEPKQVRVGYPGKPASSIDVKYKTKLNDHDRQSFNMLKHVKIMHFNVTLGVLGLAVVWRAAALPGLGRAIGLSVSSAPGDTFAIIGWVLWCLMFFLYLAKAALFPRKVQKEWFCPLRSNAFVIPPACLVLLAFVTADRFNHASTLAKVLYWMGAPLTLLIALYLCARWITDAHSTEHLNPAWLLPPTACFVCALVGPFLDGDFAEAAVLWFAFGAITAAPLYVITFQRALLFNEPDDRMRPLKWTWVAALAMACSAQAVLNGAISGSFFSALSVGPFDFTSRLLYLAALSLALMLALLFTTGHSSRLRFDISSWALAFPLEALAVATLLYAAAVPGILTNGMACAALAVSSVAVLVLSLHTLQSLLMGGIFVQDNKYGPLSQQILTHEAFRAAGERLKAACGALDAAGGAANGPALADFALQFRRYRLAHTWHAHHEESVIFKEFEAYCPGLCARQHDEHAADEAAMERWAGQLEAAEAAAASPDDADKAKAAAQGLAALKSEIPAFIDHFEKHLQGEEEHLQRGGRKQTNLDLQKQMLGRIWEGTPVEVWAEFLPWVTANLPMHGQRVKFVRCWAVWALPERAQLIGRMIAMGVEAPVWERLAASVPEIIPRGAPGWRKYF